IAGGDDVTSRIPSLADHVRALVAAVAGDFEEAFADEIREHPLADAALETPEALGLLRGELHTRHLDEFATDAEHEMSPRGLIARNVRTRYGGVGHRVEEICK